MKPSKTSLRPVARNSASPSLVGVPIVTAVWSNSAGVIWLATKRFHTSWYSFHSSAPRTALASAGVKATSVGRIASWASWALLLLEA